MTGIARNNAENSESLNPLRMGITFLGWISPGASRQWPTIADLLHFHIPDLLHPAHTVWLPPVLGVETHGPGVAVEHPERRGREPPLREALAGRDDQRAAHAAVPPVRVHVETGELALALGVRVPCR